MLPPAYRSLPRQTFKRDYLINIEKNFQKKWADEKVFEINAPTQEELGGKDLSPKEIQEQVPKWMGTFPYVAIISACSVVVECHYFTE